jgi:hypothetical protein
MRIEPDGIDLGWFALDQDGHIGFFTSGGSRIVSELILASEETYDFLDDSLEKLPEIGRASRGWFGKVTRGDWAKMMARGLFAYDFHSFDNNRFMEGEYRRVGIPTHPLKLDTLQKTVVDALRRVTWATTCFATAKVVPKDLILGL